MTDSVTPSPPPDTPAAPLGHAPAPPTRWVAVGSSAAADSTAAGAEAARLALTAADPRLLLVFASESHDLPALLTAILEVSGPVPLIGCSTAGEIATSGPGDAGVVVLALGGPGFEVATAISTDVSGHLRQAGAEVGACIAEVAGSPNRVLILLTDGLVGDQQEVVRGAYDALGAGVAMVGGCAGDDLHMKGTYQFFHGGVHQGAVVGAALGSEGAIGIGVRHGWRRVGEPMLVTSSADCRVRTLGDRPALDVYLELLDAPEEARHDPQAFTRFAITHPLGLSRRSGEEVRFIAGADFEERSLISIADVRQGGLAWIMEGDSESILAAVDSACADALAPLGGGSPLGLVAFDCIARRGVLGDEGIRREVGRINTHGGGAPVAGFYTYGEIARTHGLSGFHNQTLVVLALG